MGLHWSTEQQLRSLTTIYILFKMLRPGINPTQDQAPRQTRCGYIFFCKSVATDCRSQEIDKSVSLHLWYITKILNP